MFIPHDAPIGYKQIIDTYDLSTCFKHKINRVVFRAEYLPFEILFSSDKTCTLYLHVIRLLNYKSTQHYAIQQDFTYENFTIIFQLSIDVINTSHHLPLFNSKVYRFIVKENSAPGTYIGNIHAFNRYVISNSKLSYVLHGNDLKQAYNQTMFRIHKENGDIFLSDYLLNYKTKREYKLIVEARVDEYNRTILWKSLSSFADIIITLEDMVNREVQIIFTIPDDDQMESSVKIMNISQPHLNAGENRFIQAFRSSINLIENDAELIYLTKEEALPANTLLALFYLRGGNETSNENLLVNLQTYVQCSKEKIFNIVPFCHLSNFFHLSILSPRIYGLFNSRILDREEYENYIIHLTTSNNDIQSMTTNVNSNLLHTELFIFLKLLDINDNVPTFNRTYFYIKINENQPRGTFVTRLYAYDNDKGRNGTVRYELLSKIQYQHLFSLDKNSGILRTNHTFDREQCELYRIAVHAYDLGYPTRTYSSTVIIDVEINNINDHVPYFLHHVYRFNVEENSPIGKIVGKLTIEDNDDQEPIVHMINLSTIDDEDIEYFSTKQQNHVSRINYSTIDFLFIDSHRNESLSGLFSIDSQGFIRTLAVLDREIQPNYTFYILMYDILLKTYTAPTYVIIQILDENDNIPYEPFLSNFSSIISIKQDNHDETIIYEFKPIDLDDGLNGLVSVDCLNCTSSFYFHIINSSILTTRPQIRVPDGIYTLAFILRDHGSITSHKRTYTLTFNLTHHSSNDEQANLLSIKSYKYILLIQSWACFTLFLITWFIFFIMASWRCHRYHRLLTDKEMYQHIVVKDRNAIPTSICQIMPNMNAHNNQSFSEKEVSGNSNSISIQNYSSQVSLRSKRFPRSQYIDSHYQQSSLTMNSRETILHDAVTNTSYYEDNNDIWQPMNNNQRILYENTSTILHNKNYYFEPIDRDCSPSNSSSSQANYAHIIQRPVPISNYNLNNIDEHSQQQEHEDFSKAKRNSTMSLKQPSMDSTIRPCALPRSVTTDQFAINKNQSNRLYYYPSVQDVLDALNRHSNFKESIV